MGRFEKIEASMRRAPHAQKFSDVVWLCDRLFGDSRQRGTSHRVYTGENPAVLINLQRGPGGEAKAYQVRQVLAALDAMRIEETNSGQ
jgi:hypothetical protein